MLQSFITRPILSSVIAILITLVGILSLIKKYDKERLINACCRAIEYGAYNYKTVQSILEKGLDKTPTDDETSLEIPLHDNIRGEDYYE